jgi:pyruvate,water dikinase
MIADSDSSADALEHTGGGKAWNIWRMSRLPFCRVPPWFCLTTLAFDSFVEVNKLTPLLSSLENRSTTAESVSEVFRNAELPQELEEEIKQRLEEDPFRDSFVAVRSSGTDEDSATHSFAGQFETFLFRRGCREVLEAVRGCWASCFSQRVMKHRQDCGLGMSEVKMAVVVQVMINSECSGVAFSRHPLRPMTSTSAYIEAVYGQGEGLVSGHLLADGYEVCRNSLEVSSTVAEKDDMFVQAPSSGVVKVAVPCEKCKEPVLLRNQVVEIGQVIISLEKYFGSPQDFEWAYEESK